MALGHSPQIVTQGLVYYIDPSNTRSYAGYGNTIYNMVNSSIGGTFVGYTSNPIDNTFTRSIVFDGNDYILSNAISQNNNASALTWVVWVKRSTSNSYMTFIQYSGSSSDIGLELWNNGPIYFEIGNGGNTYGELSNNSSSWQNVAMVFDGSGVGNSARLKAYINGIQQNLTYTGTIPTTSGSGNTLYIGNTGPFAGPNSNLFSIGNMGSFASYNRALTAQEILQNYNATRKKYYPEERIVTDGLILNLDPANRNSYPGTGSQIYDLSGSGNTGTLNNGPIFSSLNGGSIIFDGSNDYINIPDANSLNPSTITLSCWVKLNTFTDNANLISKGFTSVGSPYIQYTLKMNTTANNNLYGFEISKNGTNVFVYTTTPLSINTYYHLTATYDGNTLRLYKDGVLDPASAVSSGTIASYATPVQIGRWGTQGTQHFNGNISQVQIYNRALTQQEILQNYNATKNRFVNALPPVRNNLILELDATSVSSYPGTGTSWYDTSGFSNNANFINGPTFSATGTSSSIAFDGTNDYVDMNYPSQINTGSPITLALWAKWITTGTTTATIQTLVDNNYQTAYIDGPGSIGFFIQDRPDLGGVLEWGAKPGIGITRCTSTFVVGDGMWHYITATNDGATSRLYVDGIQSGLARTAAGIGDSQPFINLGRWRFAQIRYLNGNIADFRIYNRALSDYEVKQNFDYYRTRYGI